MMTRGPRNVKVKGVTHAGSIISLMTSCGTMYHLRTKNIEGDAHKTTREIDCMACVAGRPPWP